MIPDKIEELLVLTRLNGCDVEYTDSFDEPAYFISYNDGVDYEDIVISKATGIIKSYMVRDEDGAKFIGKDTSECGKEKFIKLRFVVEYIDGFLS